SKPDSTNPASMNPDTAGNEKNHAKDTKHESNDSPAQPAEASPADPVTKIVGAQDEAAAATPLPDLQQSNAERKDVSKPHVDELGAPSPADTSPTPADLAGLDKHGR